MLNNLQTPERSTVDEQRRGFKEAMGRHRSGGRAAEQEKRGTQVLEKIGVRAMGNLNGKKGVSMSGGQKNTPWLWLNLEEGSLPLKGMVF